MACWCAQRLSVCCVSVTLWYGPVEGRERAWRTGPLLPLLAPPRPPLFAAVLLAVRSLLMIVSKLWSSFDVMAGTGEREKRGKWN